MAQAKSPPLKPHWFQILLALADGPRHGMGIRNDVLDRTSGLLRLWPAMLYGSLQKLTDAGWIEEDVRSGPEAQGDRRRFYRLTAAGRRVLAHEVERLERYVAVARERRVGAADAEN